MNAFNRRSFIRNSAVAGAVTLVAPRIAFGSRANSAIRMGIIGCGNRGTGVISTMSRNANIVIVAMADLFQDKLDASRKILNAQNKAKGFPEIPSSATYVGSRAYEKLLNNPDVDAVLVSSPAYTHADFMIAAVRAGKHVYCEKPVAPDVEGCRRVERIAQEYDGKLSMTFGFQIRRATPYRGFVDRISEGALGDILSAELHYFSSRSALNNRSGMSYDEARIRNQYHFRDLSGGILLDQGIHILDVCNWALGSHPISAVGIGGKKAAPEFGDAWTNYQILYRYPNDINVSIHSTQIGPRFGDVSVRFLGTEGIGEAHYTGGVFIEGTNGWDSGVLRNTGSAVTEEQKKAGAFSSALQDADPNKGASFIRSIESGEYLNEVQAAVDSTLTAILGREAATKGEACSWDENYFSNQKLSTGLNMKQFDK